MLNTIEKKTLPLIIAFAFVISSAKLIGYWPIFGISIFETLSIGEIMARSVPAFAFSITSFAAITLTPIPNIKENPKLHILFMATTATILVGSGIIAAISESNWHFVTFSIYLSFGIYYYLDWIGALEAIKNKTNLKNQTILFLIITPLFTMGWSAKTAKDIKDGYIYYEAKPTPKIVENGTSAFLGESSQSIFLWSYKNEETLIINKNNLESISIKPKSNLNITEQKTKQENEK